MKKYSFTTKSSKNNIRDALSVDESLKYLDLFLTDGREMKILLFITGRPDRERRPGLWAILGYGVIGPTGEPKPYVGHLRLPKEGRAQGLLWESSRKDLARIARYFGIQLDSELALKALLVAKSAAPHNPFLIAEPLFRRYARSKGWSDNRLTVVLNALENERDRVLDSGRRPGYEITMQGAVRWVNFLSLVIYFEQGGYVRLIGAKSQRLFRQQLASQLRRQKHS